MRIRGKPYLAYLLRLWQVRDKGQVAWRATTENVHTGEQRGLGGLADLFTFFEGDVGQVGMDQPQPNVGERGGEAEKQQLD